MGELTETNAGMRLATQYRLTAEIRGRTIHRLQ